MASLCGESDVDSGTPRDCVSGKAILRDKRGATASVETEVKSLSSGLRPHLIDSLRFLDTSRRGQDKAAGGEGVGSGSCNDGGSERESDFAAVYAGAWTCLLGVTEGRTALRHVCEHVCAFVGVISFIA